jgi:hypothetical protein
MKISKLPLFAAILPLAATPFLVPAQAHADTYKLVDLGTDNFRQIVDIDNLGQVVIFNSSSDEYLTYANGVLVNTTTTLPNLTYDNGTPCSVPAGFHTVFSNNVVCNNGRTGFGSLDNPNGDPSGTYTGPTDSLTLLMDTTSTFQPKLNASGDFAWDDVDHDENWEAIDLTSNVPEPGSLPLVSTGCASLFYLLRRKRS